MHALLDPSRERLALPQDADLGDAVVGIGGGAGTEGAERLAAAERDLECALDAPTVRRFDSRGRQRIELLESTEQDRDVALRFHLPARVGILTGKRQVVDERGEIQTRAGDDERTLAP